jgi:hypothetical protein
MGPRCLLCGAGVQVYTSTWSGVGGGRRWLQQSILARAMCWQDVNCGGRTFRRQRDGNQMDASSSFAVVAVLALVLSARWCRKPTALDLTALAWLLRYSLSKIANCFCQTFPLVLASRLSTTLLTACTCSRHMTRQARLREQQIDSPGRPDKSAPTPILRLSPCSKPQLSKILPLAHLIGQPEKIGRNAETPPVGANQTGGLATKASILPCRPRNTFSDKQSALPARPS